MTPETRAPETRAPETRAPETSTPETSTPETSAPDPVSFAYRFDGQGGGVAVPHKSAAEHGGAEDGAEDGAEYGARKGGAGFVWHHLRRDDPDTVPWLEERGLDRFVIEALTAEETRPRCTVHGDGVLLNLRGVNLSHGQEPEDMISVRLWIERTCVVGVWVSPTEAVSDIVASIDRHEAPVSPGDFVARLGLRLADRAAGFQAERPN